jgi:hypothetical protein
MLASFYQVINASEKASTHQRRAYTIRLNALDGCVVALCINANGEAFGLAAERRTASNTATDIGRSTARARFVARMLRRIGGKKRNRGDGS